MKKKYWTGIGFILIGAFLLILPVENTQEFYKEYSSGGRIGFIELIYIISNFTGFKTFAFILIAIGFLSVIIPYLKSNKNYKNDDLK